jgi:multimeric flavodoxin WrbA
MAAVLGICGSSRKNESNTARIMEEILKATGKSYELVWLCDLNINFCTGCLKCFSDPAAKGVCWQKDDMEGLIQKMLNCKALVLGSPTMYGNVSGRMKNMFDRSIGLDCRGIGPEKKLTGHGRSPMANRPAALVTVAGGGDQQKTAANMHIFMDYEDLDIVGEIVEAVGFTDVRENREIIERARKIGKEMGKKIR